MFYFRSKIQGLGLCAARDLEKHTMVIEYIGEVIRGELSEKREKDYESKVSLNFSYLKKKMWEQNGHVRILTSFVNRYQSQKVD